MEVRCHIRIDKEGNWFYNNDPITNKNICRYFTQHIIKDKEGNCQLEVNGQTCNLDVEDTPYIVKHINIINKLEVKIKVMLNDLTTEVVPWDQIWVKEDTHLYCMVKGGQFKARFNRNSQFELGSLLHHDEKRKKYYLHQVGKKYYLSVGK
ncbi:MAG: DUF1285 domain-containing protein [Proteobacteria bacterium]|nr:DUF1285 domain-containing protein [Pseudomonadota bacterium]